MVKMRAVVCETPGTLRIVEKPVPAACAGEVLVRIRRMGVCGTDLHIFNGKHPFLEYPRVMGHELSGEVAGVGDGVKLAVGTPVYIMPYLTCGTCIACRKGKSNCCTSMQVLGVHCDGGMTDYVVLPERVVFAADGIPLDQAALIEFLAIGAHAARRSEFEGGERTLLVGAGPIGLGCAMFARARGAEVTLVDGREDRLGFAASELGFTDAERAGPDLLDRVKRRTDGELYDRVIDATGNPKAMEASFGLVAHGGSLIFAGVVRTDLTFSDPELHKRELTVHASRNATGVDFAEVLAAIRSGTVKVEKLITHRAPLEEAVARFPEWTTPEAGVVKAMIELA
jgi:2-desacetyl-2-hydroxyethyl bacteriochlorophyllide A dehydrogenase